jgi:predicted transposase YbfD/YdcC
MLCVKGNRPKLLAACRAAAAATPQEIFSENALGHGRKSLWEASMHALEGPAGWESALSVTQVVRTVIKKGGEEAVTEAFYVCSGPNMCAEEACKGIRGHWGIENRLHRVKDVVQGEDKNRISQKNASINLSCFGTLAINLSRLNGYQSIKDGQVFFSGNIRKALKTIRT